MLGYVVAELFYQQALCSRLHLCTIYIKYHVTAKQYTKVLALDLRGTDTFRGGNSVKTDFASSKNGTAIKGEQIVHFQSKPIFWRKAWTILTDLQSHSIPNEPALDVWPVKTQISLCICTVWSESSLFTCAFYSFWDIQRGINKNPCHTGWLYRLILVFSGHTGLNVGFVLYKLICIYSP